VSTIEENRVQSGNLIVVGSSAGGVEALSILVSTLPTNFPAPIVLAQHLDPNRLSSLDVILQKRTNLIVEVVRSSTKMEDGKIYVVPANRHVSIKDHNVELLEDRLKRPRPSVDTLLSTAAETYGEHLIAVILTGSGSDGAIGAVDVKNAGGIIIVQDPQTARYPSMPLALPPTIVDFEVDIEQIGPLLYDLLTGVEIPQTEERTEDLLRTILELVSRQASIDFRPYKTSTILRRIARRMAVTHNKTLSEYADHLKRYHEEVRELVKAFLINVTQFFRDADAFVYLKNEILPLLIAQARQKEHTIRMWTAGCATGEEAYSLAMLLSDLLGTELAEWSIKIFATDLDEASITFARRGLYSENLLKGVSHEYRERFFERSDQGYRISKSLRQMVIFGQQDISHSAPFPRIDLVLCRNVLIYFTPDLQDYVLNQFAFSLNPNGYLFLGKAETVRPIQSFYEMVNKHWKVYRCIGNALPSMRHQNLLDLRTPHVERQTINYQNRLQGKQQHTEPETQLSALEPNQLRHFNELLLRFLPVGIVIIDRTYHILTANAVARRLLGLRDIAIEQDFLHAVRGIPYHETRTAIDAVFRERNFITLPEVNLESASGGNGRYISIVIALMQPESALPDLAAISVTDVNEQVQVRRQLEAVQDEQTQLMQELGTVNKRLSDMNKELMDANEELQVANEELMLTHEELQASIEEFETTNEELQATNEELETNNEELQATNEELETTNDELRARTNDLQEVTTVLESERVRLSEMIEQAPFYILLLRGPNMIVEAYNPRYARILEGREVLGHPLEEVFDLFWETRAGLTLTQLAREVYVQEALQITPRIETIVPEGEEAQEKPRKSYYFTYTLVPSHNSSGRVDGVIIYATDETEQHAREIAEEFEQIQRMNVLIKEMLDVAKLQGEVFELNLQEKVNLIKLVRRTIELLPPEEHVINMQNSEERLPITLDEGRIKQVLNNLLTNAVKYSERGTSIFVVVERHQEKNEVIVAVRDEGQGISEENQEHLFDRFYHVHRDEAGEHQGLGLGLYIARGIIQRHGGRMWLESKEGQGSCFFFSLPLKRD
jgi:two-component system CheB/CheR fusion protein